MCGNYSREETVQGQKLYDEIRQSKKNNGMPLSFLIKPGLVLEDRAEILENFFVGFWEI